MIEKILVTVNRATSECSAELVDDEFISGTEGTGLSISMKAAMAAEWCDSSRGGTNTGKITYDLAAGLLKVSVPSIKRARRIMRDSPEQFDKIKQGMISVGRAYESMYG